MFVLVKWILNYFFGEPNFILTPKVEPSPIIKKIFLRLSAWDDELLSTSKVIRFLAMSLSKLHEPAPSTVFHYSLYTNFSL